LVNAYVAFGLISFPRPLSFNSSSFQLHISTTSNRALFVSLVFPLISIIVSNTFMNTFLSVCITSILWRKSLVFQYGNLQNILCFFQLCFIPYLGIFSSCNSMHSGNCATLFQISRLDKCGGGGNSQQTSSWMPFHPF